MGKLSIFTVAAVIAVFGLEAPAMVPSADELNEVSAQVDELVKSEISGLKKGDNDARVEAADKIAAFLSDVKDTPSRFLIMNVAFVQYVQAGDGEKASFIYDQAAISHGHEFAVAMSEYGQSKKQLTAMANKNHPEVQELKKRIDGDNQKLKTVASIRRRLAKTADDKALHEELAIELIALDGWTDEVAAEFIAAGAGEDSDVKPGEIADWWWSRAEKYEKRKDVHDAFVLRAATWYRKAMDAGEFDGLKKTLVKKRIDDAEELKGALEAAAREAAAKLETLEPVKLDFNADTSVELIGCPAGEFMMGNKNDEKKMSVHRYHKVIFSRPFWMSRYKVTHKIWDQYRKYKLSKQDEALGKWNRVHIAKRNEVDDFFVWLNKYSKFKKLVPQGYVFRLPTAAEWEYALNANATDPEDLYVRYHEGRLANPVEIVCQINDVRERDKDELFGNRIGGFEVGTKKPNRWGFYDMLGNCGDHILDTIDANKINGRELDRDNQTAIKYGDTEKDPVRFFDGVTKACIVRGSWRNSFSFDHGWSIMTQADFERDQNAFHIVLGPDLIKEIEPDKPAGRGKGNSKGKKK